MMTKEEIIDLARKAGWQACSPHTIEKLVSFAKFVEEKAVENFKAHMLNELFDDPDVDNYHCRLRGEE